MVTQQLVRSNNDRVIAGVCGGLGHYFGIDAVIVRLIMVGLVFACGISVLLYPLLWLIMPSEGIGQQTLREGLQDLQRQAQAFGQQARAQWAGEAQSSVGVPRFDPQTGQPLAQVSTQQRNRVLGIILLAAGTLMLASYVGGGGIVMALMVLGGGAYLLRRTK